jgi:hypothetical protein
VAQPCVGAGSTIDQRRDGEAPSDLSSVESVALRQRAQIVLPPHARSAASEIARVHPDRLEPRPTCRPLRTWPQPWFP